MPPSDRKTKALNSDPLCDLAFCGMYRDAVAPSYTETRYHGRLELYGVYSDLA